MRSCCLSRCPAETRCWVGRSGEANSACGCRLENVQQSFALNPLMVPIVEMPCSYSQERRGQVSALLTREGRGQRMDLNAASCCTTLSAKHSERRQKWSQNKQLLCSQGTEAPVFWRKVTTQLIKSHLIKLELKIYFWFLIFCCWLDLHLKNTMSQFCHRGINMSPHTHTDTHRAVLYCISYKSHILLVMGGK